MRPVSPGGWDNRSFRIGADLVARLPSGAAYASQVEKERLWLPQLAPHLPLAIPLPVACGREGCGYPWPWSINRWIEGRAASARGMQLARPLGEFLAALHRIPAAGGPVAGPGNFHRGGELAIHGEEVRRALAVLEGRIDERATMAVWNEAVATRWTRQPVWVHGDIAPGNLLEREARLAAVIDFGNLAVGDPACDLAIAWSWLDYEGSAALRAALYPDEATWMRGRAWALWKALIVAAGLSPTNAPEYSAPLDVIARCLGR